MGVSDIQLDYNAGPVLDLSARGMQKLDPDFMCSEDTHTLILDRNNIMKLDHLERSPALQQLSAAGNRLVRMMGVCRLTELRVLNLPNNSIGYIEGLRDLPHLKWLNLSGNNIKVIEQLNNCVSLQHLDVSDNSINTVGDLTKLVALKTLLLHGNSITTLRSVPAHLPPHLSILSLAENEIRDLNEVSYLAPLHDLEQLSIMSNPCVMATPSLPACDYRPYIMSWCLSLKVLDGYVVSQKEGLKAEWLYSQGKGRSYRPGQHVQLIQYLSSVCPLTSSPALETKEDAKLEKILSKQRFHQKQLQEENRGGRPLHPRPPRPRPTQLDVDTLSPPHAAPLGGGAGEEEGVCGPAAPSESEPAVQSNTWVGCDASHPSVAVQSNTWVSCDASHPSVPVVRSPRRGHDLVYLEDVQTDEDKLNSSLLSSESTFLPLASDLEPPSARSDSDDETETFEPDSLAPKRPAPPRKHHPPPANQQQRKTLEEDVVSGPLLVGLSGPQKDLEASSGSGSGSGPGSELKEEAGCSVTEADAAAVKIQAWWRGSSARCLHPAATEVRSEIRLRRMQDHIEFLSDKLLSVQQQYEEEKLQRLLQEEALKFLWKELQSMQQWKLSVEQQLAANTPPPQGSSPGLCKASSTTPPPSTPPPNIPPSTTPPPNIPPPNTPPPQGSSPGLCKASSTPPPNIPPSTPPPNIPPSTTPPPSTHVSFPDSGFQSRDQPVQQDFLSSGTMDSMKTVRTLSPVWSPVHGLPVHEAVHEAVHEVVHSPDCSLLEQYLSSVQQREQEAEEELRDTTETPEPSSSASRGQQRDLVLDQNSPGAHLVQDQNSPAAHLVLDQNSPGAHLVQSSPGAHLVQSSPGAHLVQDQNSPGAHLVQSSPGAHLVQSSPGAHLDTEE